MNDILEAIPAECFERSALKGYSYILRDLVLITLNGLAAHYFIPQLPNPTLRFFGWMIYAFMQGLFMTGIWVLAHECGHQAFSSSRTINDFTGWVMHSALLVPYFSWQSSHSRHHKGTSNLSKDTVFNPKTLTTILERRGIDPKDFPVDEHGEMSEEVEDKLFDMIEDSPLYSLIHLTLQQLFGWIMYLSLNSTGQKYPTHSKWAVNHFNPSSPFFKREEYNRILWSDLGIILAFAGLGLASKTWGFMNVVCYYGVPYLWVNHWLVMITYLQHTDPALPHYRAGTWNFQRGAAATMDRDFGFIGQHLLHDIIEVDPISPCITFNFRVFRHFFFLSCADYRLTSPTTSAPAFPSTMAARQLKQSARSSGTITNTITRTSSSLYGGPPECVNGLLIPATSSSSRTQMD